MVGYMILFIGRMIGRDPIIGDFISTQDFNGYRYVLNTPLRYTDLKGYEYDPVTVYGEYDDWWNSHEFMHPGPGREEVRAPVAFAAVIIQM